MGALFMAVLVLLLPVRTAPAPESERARIDVLGLVSSGEAELGASPADVGSADLCFDGLEHTQMRSAGVNPAFVQVAFSARQTVNLVRVLVGQPAFAGDVNDWWLETADSEEDLQTQSGSYRPVVPKREGIAGTWDEVWLSTTVSARIWRFWIQRVVGDDFVHIPELQLWYDDDPGPRISSVSATPFPTTILLEWTTEGDAPVAAYRIWQPLYESQWVELMGQVQQRRTFTVQHLSPATDYVFRIEAVDETGTLLATTDTFRVSTLEATDDMLRVANLDVLVPLYVGGMTSQEIEGIRRAVDLARAFYFRNSLATLNLDCTVMRIGGWAPPTGGPTYANLEADLRARGVREDQFDGIHTVAANLYGCYGGWGNILGRAGASYGRVCGAPYPGHDPEIDYPAAWAFSHEFGHVLHGVLAPRSGFHNMVFNHFPWAYPLPEGVDVFDAGMNYDGMALVLRLYGHHLEYASPWNGYIEVRDADRDGLPDDDSRVPIDEIRFGSSNALADTDGDGLSDLEEAIAGIYGGTDPTGPDTDGDGLSDGSDPNPLDRFDPQIPEEGGNVALDGTLDAGEHWHPLADGTAYSALPGLALSTYASWDDSHLYFAFESNEPLKIYLGLDASGEDGVHTSPVKFPGGDYASGERGINAAAYGDSYHQEAFLILRPDSGRVYLKGAALSGSRVAARQASGIHVLEARIPHDLPPGRGWNYVAPDAPMIDAPSFEQGDVLGIQVLVRALDGSNGVVTDDWYAKGAWATQFELDHFNDALLVEGGSGTDTPGNEPEATQPVRWVSTYPDPFVSATTVRFQVARMSTVRLDVFDLLGRHVRTLVGGRTLTPGMHSVRWDGRDGRGTETPAGMYAVILSGSNGSVTRLVVRLKP